MSDYIKYEVEVYKNGDKLWYKNGKLHREDGPAIEFADGSKNWCKNGECHREDGPACEYANGNKSWYKNGKLHRVDGPAVIHTNGDKYWFLNGKQYYTEAEFNKEMSKSPCEGKIVEIDGKKYTLTSVN